MNNKCIILILVYVFCLLSANAQTIEPIKPTKYKRVTQAYGYLIGQEYSLGKIKKDFPSLELNVLKAQLAFNSTFGKSKENLVIFLKENLGATEFATIAGKLEIETKKILGRQILSEDAALQYLNEVETRATGIIASPILETLLSYQFLNQPLNEVANGFFYTFKTKSHPKSKNTDWHIKVPKSWKAEEAERPNIIQQFTSDYGDGDHSLMLIVKDLDLPKGTILSKQELNEFFSEKEMRNVVPSGGRFISFTKMSLDNHIGGMLHIEQTIDRLDLRVKVRTLQFMFIRGNKLYNLQGHVGSLKTPIDLNSEMQRYLPFYKSVANSIVVNDQYK